MDNHNIREQVPPDWQAAEAKRQREVSTAAFTPRLSNDEQVLRILIKWDKMFTLWFTIITIGGILGAAAWIIRQVNP